MYYQLCNVQYPGRIFIFLIFSVLISVAIGCTIPPMKKGSQNQATITFNRKLYSFSNEIFITVEDIDENQDASIKDTLNVSFLVLDRDEKRTLILTETGVNTGIFRNSKGLLLAGTQPTAKDSQVYVTGGEIINVTYIDKDDPSDRHVGQAMIIGGRFHYDIDPSLTPAQENVAGEPNRPIGVVINPGGSRDEFVLNEIILKTDDPSVVQDILKKYDGKMLYDGSRRLVSPSNTKDKLSALWELGGYKLLRVNPSTADRRYLVSHMTEQGLTGKFVFSSEQALDLGAILLAEQELGRNVTLNSYHTADGCPCQGTRENFDTALGANEDAFDYRWFNTLNALGDEYFGVTKAWQLLNGLGIPNNLPNDWLPAYNWEPVRLGIIDGGFMPNNDWPGGVRPAWCLSFNGNFSFSNPYGISTDCAGVSQVNCTDGRPCPWHGTMVYGVAAGLANNNFGSAGTAGSCDDPIAEIMLSEWDGTQFSWAANIMGQIHGEADVINLSSSGLCNRWCRIFGAFSGKSILSSAIDQAGEQGILIVAAAGNQGEDLDVNGRWRLPCEYEGVICVSSINWSCPIPGTNCFPIGLNRNFGSNVDIWAPEVIDVWTPADNNTTPPFTPVEDQHRGTSVSAPYVAGVLAMMKALYPPEERRNFNLASARLLLQATADTTVSTSPNVNAFGGIINPFAMALSLLQSGALDAHLINFDIADFDDNEPNETLSEATTIDFSTATTPGTIDGIITTEEDVDVFRFNLDDYYNVTFGFNNVSTPGQILLSNVLSTSGASPINNVLPPGGYQVIVEADRSIPLNPFNCYQLQFSRTFAVLDPDVFDDGDTSTPSPGSPARTNNDFRDRTLLELVPDPLERESSIEHADLNFHTREDRDYFRVRLPPRSNTNCRSCSCGRGEFCSEVLEITVDSAQPLDIWILSTDGTLRFSPYQEGWEQLRRNPDPTYRVIRINCPYNLIDDGIMNADFEIAFVIEPDPSRQTRTYYDLSVLFDYLHHDECEDNSGGPAPFITAGIIRHLIPEEPSLLPFPSIEEPWDCEHLPGCGPPYEYYRLNWKGGDFMMAIEYFTLVRPGYPTIELVNSEGKRIQVATSVPVTKISSGLAPHKFETHGKMNLSVQSLESGNYFIKVDAPLPTNIFYWGGNIRK